MRSPTAPSRMREHAPGDRDPQRISRGAVSWEKKSTDRFSGLRRRQNPVAPRRSTPSPLKRGTDFRRALARSTDEVRPVGGARASRAPLTPFHDNIHSGATASRPRRRAFRPTGGSNQRFPGWRTPSEAPSRTCGTTVSPSRARRSSDERCHGSRGPLAIQGSRRRSDSSACSATASSQGTGEARGARATRPT
jgi:hypothetical protein